MTKAKKSKQSKRQLDHVVGRQTVLSDGERIEKLEKLIDEIFHCLQAETNLRIDYNKIRERLK